MRLGNEAKQGGIVAEEVREIKEGGEEGREVERGREEGCEELSGGGEGRKKS